MRPMSFEDALFNLKLGKAVRRTNWRGENMHIFLVPEAACQVPHKYSGGYHVQASLWMKTPDDSIVPWVISQTCILADDWVVLESPQRQDQKALEKVPS